MAWSTFLGGGAADNAYAVAALPGGDLVVVGSSASTNFPTTSGAFQRTKGAGTDAVVTRIRADGVTVVWSTFLGGAGEDFARGVATDPQGNIYITGNTNSPDFPVTSGAYMNQKASSHDAFVTKLSPNGNSVVWSTFLGANWDDYSRGIAVDGSGVTVAGFTNSSDFPVTAGVVRSTRTPSLFDGADGFVTKLSSSGSALVYSTYLGSNGGTDEIMALALDPSGRPTLAGWTVSTGFPTTSSAYDRTLDGRQEAFVTRLNATATGYVFSTFVGSTEYDEAYGIAVDANGNSYVVGRTTSPAFPTTSGAYQRTFGGGNYYDAFVFKLNAAGSALTYSTYLGGATNDAAYSVCVAEGGQACVTGLTDAANFPVTTGALGTTVSGGVDAFTFALNPTGSQLLYSTYIGGSVLDLGNAIALLSSGRAVVVGSTESANYPATPGVLDPTHNNALDCFVSTFDLGLSGGSTAVGDLPTVLVKLSAPRPNPFRASTGASFTLERPGRVAAQVLDLQGRRVRNLLDQDLQAGAHNLVWDGRDDDGRELGAGVYHLEISTPGWRVARAVVRLR